jgi:hypothetical protein
MFSWRCGRKITLDHQNIIQERAIICACYKWEGEDEVHALTWNNGNDRQLCEDLSLVLSEADELIAHNGDRFDIRWFNARCLIHHLPPQPMRKTVDTLRWARSSFYLNSNRLDYLGKLLLGEGKIRTEFELWRNIVLANDQASMERMVEYCKKDVRLLERVWSRLRDYVPQETHAGVTDTHDPRTRWTCAHCGSSNVATSKTRITKMGMVRREMKCGDCGRFYSIADSLHTEYLRWKLQEGSAA